MVLQEGVDILCGLMKAICRLDDAIVVAVGICSEGNALGPFMEGCIF